MMKNKDVVYWIVAVLVVVILAIFFWNNYQTSPSRVSTSKECGIESCHGLDITCGPNVPEVCTMIYKAGDNCRQYVDCQVVGGRCELKKSPKFDSCKSCVEKCEQGFQNNPMKVFQCESKCTE